MIQKNVPDPDLSSLIDYLTGELTPEEHTAVAAWVNARPERRRLLAQLAEMWQTTQARSRPKADVAAMERAMTQYMSMGAVTRRENERETEQKLSRRAGLNPLRGTRREGVIRHVRRAAWSVVATGVAGLAVFAGWHIVTHRLIVRNNSDAAVTVYTTAQGERANITLPDGSTVALNVASRLEVPTDYTAGDRTLRLAGEAFFTVQHHNRAPFTVISGAVATRVLGTSFLVRHYAADTVTEVAVRDGRVTVHSAVVSGGQHVWVAQHAMSRPGPVAATRFSFVTGVLYLDGVTLRDAVPDLNRWYNVDVRFGDAAAATRRISSGFAAGSSHELEEFLTWTMHLRVVRHGRVLTLFSQ